MDTKLGRVMTCDEGNSPIMSNHFLITRSREVTWQKGKLNILSDAMPMTTKHDRLMTYGDSNPPVESHDSLRIWWQVVRWQIESITNPFWQGLWQWNLASWQLNVKRRHPWSNISSWPPGHIKSCETLRTKYFFLQKMHGRQPLPGPDIW